MAELKSRLQADLNAAMKARDELTTATLRMALTAITTEEVAGKQARELADDEVVKVLVREAKKRREAAEAFAAAGRAGTRRARAGRRRGARSLPAGAAVRRRARRPGPRARSARRRRAPRSDWAR